MIAAFVIMSGFDIVTVRLPRKIAYLRLGPVERYTVRINSRTVGGRRERAELEARLRMIANSETLRQTIYRDPENDQHWLGVFRDQGHSSCEDLKPLDRQQLEETRRRFEMWEDRPVPVLRD